MTIADLPAETDRITTVLAGDLKDGMRRAYDGATISGVLVAGIQYDPATGHDGRWATDPSDPRVDEPCVMMLYDCRNRSHHVPAHTPIKVVAEPYDF